MVELLSGCLFLGGLKGLLILVLRADRRDAVQELLHPGLATRPDDNMSTKPGKIAAVHTELVLRTLLSSETCSSIQTMRLRDVLRNGDLLSIPSAFSYNPLQSYNVNPCSLLSLSMETFQRHIFWRVP